MNMDETIRLYNDFAEWDEGLLSEACNFITDIISKNDGSSKFTVIEPGFGLGLRAKYFLKNCNWIEKYIGIDNSELDPNLKKYVENIKDEFDKDKLELIFEDFLKWKYKNSENDTVVILSYFLHWLGTGWTEGVQKTVELHPRYIILIGGGLPYLPTNGVKYVLPYLKRDLKENEILVSWLKFLFSIQNKMENKGKNFVKPLTAQDYISVIEYLIQCNYYELLEFKVLNAVGSIKKIVERDIVKDLYRTDPLRILPVGMDNEDKNEIINEFLSNFKNKTVKFEWRQTAYVAILSRKNSGNN